MALLEQKANERAPEVTVVIPTRNRWNFLRTTLKCVLDQEHVRLELLVVDDGSTDETRLKLWAPSKLRVQLDAARAAGASWAYASGLVMDRERGDVHPDVEPPPPEALPGALLPTDTIPGGCSNVMARTSLVRQLGGFDEALN